MIRHITSAFKKALLLTVFVLSAVRLLAAVEPYQNQLRGSIRKGDVLSVKDEKFQNSAYDWSRINNLAVNNMITFSIFRDSAYTFNKPFHCEIELTVEYWSRPDQKKPVTIDDVKLKINYDTAYGATYQGTDVYHFKNAHRFKVTVKSISSPELGDKLPSVFTLNAQVFVDRRYLPADNEKPEPVKVSTPLPQMQAKMTGFSVVPMGSVTNLAANVDWGYVTGAEEYDLEWTFIDATSTNGGIITSAGSGITAAQVEPMFRNNATRVTLPGHHYKISLVHSNKYLLVRWRGVSYEDGGTFRREGVWNYTVDFNGSQQLGVIQLPMDWHYPNLNWQYNAAYADEGRKKEVVSYFDGTLRGRQTVTVSSPDNNSDADDQAIVQQNVYDEFGRVAANVLPAPVPGSDLKYYGNVNFYSSGVPYTRAHVYDSSVASCILPPKPLATLGGASMYYSPVNTFINDAPFNKYLPDAKGYPFSVVHYTPDNTGRIMVQGGVGQAMQPGANAATDHATRYFYTRPYEGELERLFGNDVGDPSHYLKKIVVDPNKQISLSYENASGKTIATALAGAPPAGIDALPSAGAPVNRIYPVLKADNMVFDRSSLTLRGYTTYVNTMPGHAKLGYEVERLIRQYEENGVSICSNCYYALRIKMTDDCGTPVGQWNMPVTIGSATSDCSVNGKQTAELDLEFGKIGTHYITFELAMDPDMITNYTNDFITRNTNLRTEFSFILEALKNTDFSGCFTECETCLQSIGTRDHFVERLNAQMLKYNVDPYTIGAPYDNWVNGLYNALLTQCQNQQASCMNSPCDDLKQSLMRDVSPGGQYALFTEDSDPMDPEVNVLNNYWRLQFPILDKNAPGYINTRFELPDGTVTSPHDANFTLSMLITYWKPEWAERFLSYHPEYCALSFCSNNTAYLTWDRKVKELYNTVADIPKINGGLEYEPNNPLWLLAVDPFFSSGAPGFPYLQGFIADLQQYSTRVLGYTQSNAAVKNISKYVDYRLYCLGNGNMTQLTEDTWNNCAPVASCRIPDREWQLYRELYMEMKEKLYTTVRNASCKGACPVGIPESMFSACPNASDYVFREDTTGSSQFPAGFKMVRALYQGRKVSQDVYVYISYSAPYKDTANTSVFFNHGESAQNGVLWVRENTPLNAIHVDSIACKPHLHPPVIMRAARVAAPAGGPGIPPGNIGPQCVPAEYINISATSDPGGGYTNTITYTGPDIAVGNSIKAYFVGGYGPDTYGTLLPPITFTHDNQHIPQIIYDSQIVWLYATECIGSGPGTGDFCSTVTRNDFSLSLVAHDAGRDIWTYDLSYNNTQTPVPVGIYVDVYCFVGNTTSTFRAGTFTSANYGSPIRLDRAFSASISHIVCSTSGSPDCPPIYRSKISRVIRPGNMPTDTATLGTELRFQLAEAIQTSCEAQAERWMDLLTPCLQQYPDSASKREALRDALIKVCMAGGDLNHPDGASTLPAGKTTTYGDASFEDAVKRVLGISSMNMLCNSWILESPYPYNVKPQMADPIVLASSQKLCDKLAALKMEHVNSAPGITFFQYLRTKYGAALTLNADEVAMLEKSCSNCRYLLPRPLKLPVFMDPESTGCVNAATFNQAWNEVQAFAPDNTHANYNLLVTSYLNQRWGFTLGFSDYAAYRTKVQGNNNAQEMLCNAPAFGSVEVDPYGCVLDMMAGAINGGKRHYVMYIDSVKEDFRRNYVSFCGNNKAKATVTFKEQQYHYTLYYYDQAGNLLRTIPPEGVQLLDDATALQAAKSREAPNVACTYNGPSQNTDKATALTKLSQTIAADNGSVELWLNGDFGAARQLITTPDAQYLLNICVDGRYLSADVYALRRLPGGGAGLGASNHVRVDMAAALPLKEWIHVVIQGDRLADKAMQVYVNGVKCPASPNAPKGSCNWQVSMNGTLEVLPEDISLLKHLRLYNRLLTDEEIRANAGEVCMGINSYYYNSLVVVAGAPLQHWARFNAPPAGGGTAGSEDGIEKQSPLVFPGHRMPTSYAYTSLNQVLKQKSPDGGESRFWYDKAGRLFASQNAEQLSPTTGTDTNCYSYTKYDALGRIIEAGEKRSASAALAAPGFIDRQTAGTFTSTGSNTQIVQSLYDEAHPALGATLQKNLRKRIAASLYKSTDASTPGQITYYSYDQSGHAQTIWQQLEGLPLRRLDYQYDMASGKLKKLRYAPLFTPTARNFLYSYQYDGENRLVSATTGINTVSTDGWALANERTEASYQYYLHGPLARAELGHDKVQGLDYAYTLQGWLKGINGTDLTADMGSDGYIGTHSTVGRDIMAQSLGYFEGDYEAIGGGDPLKLQWTAQPGDFNGNNLYNGNISRATLALKNVNGDVLTGYSYRYDQLNRLVRSRQHSLSNGQSSWGINSLIAGYAEDLQYDANGNILGYVRKGTGGADMDRLRYNYEQTGGLRQNNRLNYVYDTAGAVYTSGDIRDLGSQSANNYNYDKIGNLVSDAQEGISSITWTVYGKIGTIRKADGSSLTYAYDASGHRVSKTYTQGGVSTTTWYLRDAQGNMLAVYEKAGSGTVMWKEQHLYGSSRLGMWKPALDANASDLETAWNTAGTRVYEVSNHLGNVLGTVSDNKVMLGGGDYYAFGMMQPGRRFGVSTRMGFNGKENDHEVKGEGNQQDYGMRVYDPRVGRFLSVDPITKQYPELTPYQFASNRPIQGIDLDGMELLEINSSAYRMKYLGSIPILKEQTAEKAYVNSVQTMEVNLPKGYKPAPNVLVGTAGKDFYVPPGPTFKDASSEPYSGDDDGESVQKTERTVKTQGGKMARAFRKLVVTESVPQKAINGGNLVTAPQELLKIGVGIYEGIKSFKEMRVNVKEEELRNAFYTATKIVDATLTSKDNINYINELGKVVDVGAFRADLINYITDGTWPSQFTGDQKQKSYYQNEVLRVGDILMKDNNIGKRDNKKTN